MSGVASSLADRLALILVRALLAVIAVVVALAGLGVMTWAGFKALTYVMDPAWAGLITGGSLFGLAVVLSLVALLLRSPGRSQPDGAAKGAADPKMIASDAALAAIREHPKSSSLVALVAGLVLGVSPDLRRAALDVLDAG